MTGKKDGNITWEDGKKNARPFSKSRLFWSIQKLKSLAPLAAGVHSAVKQCKAPSGNLGFAESQTTASWGAPSVSAKSKTCGEVQH